jgi:hypothetical protein
MSKNIIVISFMILPNGFVSTKKLLNGFMSTGELRSESVITEEAVIVVIRKRRAKSDAHIQGRTRMIQRVTVRAGGGGKAVAQWHSAITHSTGGPPGLAGC